MSYEIIEKQNEFNMRKKDVMVESDEGISFEVLTGGNGDSGIAKRRAAAKKLVKMLDKAVPPLRSW